MDYVKEMLVVKNVNENEVIIKMMKHYVRLQNLVLEIISLYVSIEVEIINYDLLLINFLVLVSINNETINRQMVIVNEGFDKVLVFINVI